MKTYGQYCGVARGLDLVGDRWTLLIIRELALGDRRYGELAHGLPGIATNLLAGRLRHLGEAGIVEQRGPSPSTPRYGLTARGRDLLPTLYALVRWATPEMVSGPAHTDVEEPRWVAFAALAYLQESPTSLSVRIALTAADERIWIDARDGTVEVDVGSGDVATADVHVSASTWALMGLVAGAIEPTRIAIVDPAATISGSRPARRALSALLTHNAR